MRLIRCCSFLQLNADIRDACVFRHNIKQLTGSLKEIFAIISVQSVDTGIMSSPSHSVSSQTPSSSMSFLGFIISQGNIELDSAKVSAVTSPVHDSRTQLQHFLGFANLYCGFIHNYSSAAAPLTAF